MIEILCQKCHKPAKPMIESSEDIVTEFTKGDLTFYLHVKCWENIMWDWYQGNQCTIQ
jgi:hypothetical protein